jgi:predicted nucleic acid-binding protein
MGGSRALIADASPLILLAKAGRLELLLRVASRVFVPRAVLDEVRRGQGPDARLVEEARLEVRAVPAPALARVRALDVRLGPGEAAAVALALALDGDVLTDDRSARRTARLLGVGGVGSLGIVLAANRRGLPANEARVAIGDLVAAGLWIAPPILLQAVAALR